MPREILSHEEEIIEGEDHKIAETIISNTVTKDQKILSMDSMQATTAADVRNGETMKRTICLLTCVSMLILAGCESASPSARVVSQTTGVKDLLQSEAEESIEVSVSTSAVTSEEDTAAPESISVTTRKKTSTTMPALSGMQWHAARRGWNLFPQETVFIPTIFLRH